MDRYVIREPRVGADYPQGNQMMAFSINAGRSNIMPSENVYYSGPCTANQFPSQHNVPNSRFTEVAYLNTPVFQQNVMPGQNQVITGIDPRYLANYSDDSAQYIVTGQPMQGETNSASLHSGFGSNYQNQAFSAPSRNNVKTFIPQAVTGVTTERPKQMNHYEANVGKNSFQPKQYAQYENVAHVQQAAQIYSNTNTSASKPTNETEITKKEPQYKTNTKMDKIKALYKSGPRAFSGPVEKVLKWHKALQDIGVFVFYEIVAKCVSVRPGESGSKNLVIRDDNGPAMQVVYYEIDFLLPELKVPSTVRVIGRMMAGTCRLQAFNVRPATGDDVATLSRRAAVAAHHVARLVKDFGNNQ